MATSIRNIIALAQQGSGATSSHAHNDAHTIWGALEKNSSSTVHESSDSDSQKKPKDKRQANWEPFNSTTQKSLDGVLLVGDSTSSSKKSRSVATEDDEHEAIDESVLEDRSELLGGSTDFSRLRQLPHDALVDALPKDESGNSTSIGSANHPHGPCSPCVFTQRARGCKQGIYCGFCHFPHPEHVEKKRNRQRPCKLQRQRFDGYIERLKLQVDSNPDDFNPDDLRLPPSVTKNATKTQRVLADLKEFHQHALARKQGSEGGRESKLSLREFHQHALARKQGSEGGRESKLSL